METKSRVLTPGEYEKLSKAIGWLGCISSWPEFIANIAMGLKAAAACVETTSEDLQTIGLEIYEEGHFMELLSTFHEISMNHGGDIPLPEFSVLQKGGES